MEAPRWIDATEVRQAVSADRARRLIRQVLAEDVATALREADRANVFKSVGMSWEDLVIAAGAAHP